MNSHKEMVFRKTFVPWDLYLHMKRDRLLSNVIESFNAPPPFFYEDARSEAACEVTISILVPQKLIQGKFDEPALKAIERAVREMEYAFERIASEIVSTKPKE